MVAARRRGLVDVFSTEILDLIVNSKTRFKAFSNLTEILFFSTRTQRVYSSGRCLHDRKLSFTHQFVTLRLSRPTSSRRSALSICKLHPAVPGLADIQSLLEELAHYFRATCDPFT